MFLIVCLYIFVYTFRVVVDVCDKDNVFDGSLWPVGADVCDWWFSSNKQSYWLDSLTLLHIIYMVSNKESHNY